MWLQFCIEGSHGRDKTWPEVKSDVIDAVEITAASLSSWSRDVLQIFMVDTS